MIACREAGKKGEIMRIMACPASRERAVFAVFFGFFSALVGCGGCGDDVRLGMLRCGDEYDEGATRSCSTRPDSVGVGACVAGVETCHHGYWTSCIGEVTPGMQTEICNGVDDDCDGTVDDDIAAEVLPWDGPADAVLQSSHPQSVCRPAGRQCVDGAWMPRAAVYPASEMCDGLDNDCDGFADNHVPMVGTPCGARETLGVCAERGDWACAVVSDGVGQLVCVGARYPSPEICNEADDDCDGDTDEGDVCATCERNFTVVGFVDDSGSIGDELPATKDALDQAAAVFADSTTVLALVGFPGTVGDWHFVTSPSFGDVTSFRQAVQRLGASGRSFEPIYDVLAHWTDGTAVDIVWPVNTESYIFIVVADETALQSRQAATPAELEALRQRIANQVSQCVLPGCGVGQRIRVIVVTRAAFFPQYDGIVMDSADLIELQEPSSGMPVLSFTAALVERLKRLGECGP